MSAGRLFFIFLIAVLLLPPGDGNGAPPLPDPQKLKYPALTFSPPEPQRVELENGMVLYVLEDRELPVVNISAVIRTGSAYDPEGREGLADLTARVMRTGGTRSMTGDEVDNLLEFTAATLSLSAGTDAATADFFVLKKDFDRVFGVFADILMAPAFNEKKLELAKNLKIEELRRIADVPQKLAFREFRKVLYSGNPRGRLSTVESIGRIEREDLEGFHRRFFSPRNVMMAVSGDIDGREIVEKFRRHFGSWRGDGPVRDVPPPGEKLSASIHYLQKEGPQSTIIIGFLAPEKKSDDFYPFTLLDFIVGSGGFRSRIFSEIRSNLGLAYSAGSYYEGRTGYGVFGSYAITKSDATGRVFARLQEILKDVTRRRVGEEELLWAKRSIVNSFIFSFSSTDMIATQQMMIEFLGLPPGYLRDYRGRIEAVPPEDLLRVAVRYLRGDRATVLIVGDEKNFDRPLSSFGDVRKIEAK
ncbi:MAG TPA: pitrilysin family protein [Syntrophales bacterium]|nr:pitrilysin family protein [Syntrophales bacterium]HRT61297.1 pitrilysin family protein [Syntrophales bacterium]